MRYLTVEQFIVRAGSAVPRIESGDNAGQVDTARIEAALDDASAECRVWLADDLFDADGTLIDPVPQRLSEVLPGIVFDIAIYRLTDGATGAEDPITRRYNAARKLLREGLKEEPERPGARAAMVEGHSQWLPEKTAADDDDEEDE